MKHIMRLYSIIILMLFSLQVLYAQPVPNIEENIPYLMTFGEDADISWGDDDFSQAFFFLIPVDYSQQIFIRVFDPDIGGAIDEYRGEWNTQCSFEVFGGKGCHSEDDARETSPTGNYKSGTLLAKKVFGENPRYDEQWYTFGPFNPAEGEYDETYDGHIFKVICEGISGDDGNMFKYYLSTSGSENIPIQGSNAFAYEYSFRMHNDPNEVSHIYPYIPTGTLSVKISNFDWDYDGDILVVSIAKDGGHLTTSGDAVIGAYDENWIENELPVQEEEIGNSYDFQFAKSKNPVVKNNNVVVNVRNQFDKTLPFYTSPIGVYKYQYDGMLQPID